MFFISQTRSHGPHFSAIALVLAILLAGMCITATAAAPHGELDNAFQPSVIQENQAIANVVLVQPDGKVLYAGFFLTVNRAPQSYIVRFNPDGTVDTSFDTGNTFTFDASISAIALQSDGKIIVAGSFDKVGGVTKFSVARLDSDGSFDPSFNVAFPARVSSVRSVAVQADGKILIGGDFSSIGGVTRNGFARVNADGSLDTTFVTPCNTPGTRALLVQPDGKVLVGNSCGIQSNPGVARLNADGTVDTAFDAGTGANGSAVTSLALQADGKVFVGGRFSNFNATGRKGIVRLNDNGAVDTTFTAATTYGTNSIALQTDGKIFIAQNSPFQGAVPVNRLNADGTNDTSFNANQSQVNDIFSIAIAPDGNLYEAGKMNIDGPNFSVVYRPVLRLTPTGTIDTAFDPDVVYPSLSAGVSCVVAQPDGKILAAGQFTIVNRIARRALVRFNANGDLDTTFNVDPTAGLANGSVNVVVLQPDGKILVGSSLPTAGANRLLRLNADGSRDTSFNVLIGDSGDAVKYIALQSDGKILVAGTFTVIGGQTRSAHFARLNADGSVDAFNPTFNGPGSYVTSLLVQPDGKFVIGGNFTQVNGVTRGTSARFNADGSLDLTFVNTDFGFSIANYAATQPDGKFLLLTPGSLLRFNADNTPDNTFTPPSFRVTGNSAGSIISVAVQANGKIVVGGQFDFVSMTGSPVRKNFARLNPDGTLDTGFGTYGGATGGNVNKVELQADGRILIGGVFKMVNGFGHSGLARLNSANLQVNGFTDFDGDGLSDASVFRGGTWYASPSSGSIATPINGLQFGLATDTIAPADYDGDGKTDVAVWREAEPGGQAYFYILQSSTGTVRTDAFGLTGDAIMSGDWDGDGKADVATYRDAAQSNFFFRGSLNNPTGIITYLQWGTSGDQPLRGDFDGDGRLDLAVFRPSDQIWYIRNSSSGQITYTSFGLAADMRVPADFDGDGKTDIAVFRDGIWYILQSSDGQIRYKNWGLSSDVLTPGDYDGDGKTDAAVFRDGIYYIQNSSNSAVGYRNFGLAGDKPIASAYSRTN